MYWQDITNRKQMEDVLRESEEQFRIIFENSTIGKSITLIDGTMVRINQAFAGMLGYTLSEMQQINFTHVTHPDDIQMSQEYVRSLLSGKQANYHFEKRYLHKNGSPVWVDVSATLMKNRAGSPLYFITSILNITERKKSEQVLARAKDELEIKVQERTAELAESENKYRLLVENASEAIIVNQNERNKFFNSKALELFGYPGKEFAAKHFIEFTFADDRALVMERYNKRIQGKAVPASYEHRIICKDGSIKWVLLNAVLISWEGKPATLSLLTDITWRKNLEQELKTYAQKITQVQEEERKRIAYELHDDTAQYLSILKMEIEALLKSEKIQSPEVLEKLEFLRKDAERAFNDVRRYSHELRPGVLEHLGLQAALEQIVDDINILKQIPVELHVEGDEPEVSEDVKLAFFRIAQEALNNARKYSKAGRLTIDLRYNPDQILMMVSDNGVGFNIKEASARIGSKGNLGLMSMRERAKLINADLKIESRPGQGTRVILKAKISLANDS